MLYDAYKTFTLWVLNAFYVLLLTLGLLLMMGERSISENGSLVFLVDWMPQIEATTDILTFPARLAMMVITPILPAGVQTHLPTTPAEPFFEGLDEWMATIPGLGATMSQTLTRWRLPEVMQGTVNWLVPVMIILTILADVVVSLCIKHGEEVLGNVGRSMHLQQLKADLKEDFKVPDVRGKEYEVTHHDPLPVNVKSEVRPVVSGLISEVRNLQDQIHQDSMTLLYNKGYFMKAMKKGLDYARMNQNYLSLIFMDIDNFKKLNDTYGHTFGDEVLKGVAKILKKSCTTNSTIPCRYGGEELCIIISGMPPEACENLAETIRQKISVSRFPSNPDVQVTASVGVHTVKFRNDPNYDPDLQQFIDLSDQQVYTAKRNGKNQVRASRQV